MGADSVFYPGEAGGVPIEEEPTVLTVHFGDSVNLNKAYAKNVPEGWIFTRYVTKSGYTGWTWSGTWKYSSGYGIDTTTNTLTLYTVYSWGGYKIIYHANGGEGEDIIDNVTTGDRMTVRYCPFTRPGYHFKCWSVSPTGTKNEYGWTEGGSWIWKYQNGQYGIQNNELHLYTIWEAD